MHSDLTLSLASICVGIAISGAAVAITRKTEWAIRTSLGLVYLTFGVILSLPLVSAMAPGLFVFLLPVLFVMLVLLPPVIHYYVGALTAHDRRPRILVRDTLLPGAAVLVCIGFWLLPASTKSAMLVSGDLPPALFPAALALMTFGLVLSWLGVSAVYLVAAVQRLRVYRAFLRQHYSNLDARDLRWVDWVMALLVGLWAATAASLATDNLGNGPLFAPFVLYGLTAGYLVFLTVFATVTPPTETVEEPPAEPTPKYAKSALSDQHAEKLAARIETAMRNDTLYLDPNLSLQKLSRHVGAPPNLVSQTLNDQIGSSFFDYVAHWRIEASKPMILANDASVLTVALDVGFNSRSTFYKASRRETGATPKAFRDALQDTH